MDSPLDTPLPPDDTGHLPILDDRALAALLASLDFNADAVDAFAAAFIAHWPERLRRTEKAIAAEDGEAIIDSALSIKVAGQMIGAVRLSALGRALEELVRQNRADEALALVDVLRAAGDATIAALTTARSTRVRTRTG